MDMEATRQDIKQYVLNPDQRGSHLRQLAEYMGRLAWENDAGKPRGQRWPDVMNGYVEGAAEQVAVFIHKVWDGAGPGEYAPRTWEMIKGHADSMSGMPFDEARLHALHAVSSDIRYRNAVAREIRIDPKRENELMHGLHKINYLADIFERAMEIHWERKHNPDNPEAVKAAGQSKRHILGPRGDPIVDVHVDRAVREAIVLGVEQINIARGNILEPTQPAIVYRDRRMMEIRYGMKWPQTCDAMAWDFEGSYATTEGRDAARHARLGWKAPARERSIDAVPAYSL